MHDDLSATFLDGRRLPVHCKPSVLLPSTTVIIVSEPYTLWSMDVPWRVLVHQRSDNGWWGFPGGSQEIGESILACASRECQEETGYTVELTHLVSVDSDPCRGACMAYCDRVVQYTNITFLARVCSGGLRCSAESRQLQWVETTCLPMPFLFTHRWRLAQARTFPRLLPVR